MTRKESTEFSGATFEQHHNHCPKTTGDWEREFDEWCTANAALAEQGRELDALASFKVFLARHIEAAERRGRKEALEETRDAVNRMMIKKPRCYCREYSMGAHNCDETSNAAITDVLSALQALLNEQEGGTSTNGV